MSTHLLVAVGVIIVVASFPEDDVNSWWTPARMVLIASASLFGCAVIAYALVAALYDTYCKRRW